MRVSWTPVYHSSLEPQSGVFEQEAAGTRLEGAHDEFIRIEGREYEHGWRPALTALAMASSSMQSVDT
jgi:hypothetical protein